MKKSGGVIAVISGILALLAAAITLLFGGIGAALKADRANDVIGFGWGGIFLSFIIIILGSVAINAKTRTPGILIIISSVAGAILGGSLVAILMVLALAGGILAAIENPEVTNESTRTNIDFAAKTSTSMGDAWIGIGIVLVLIFIAIAEPFDKSSKTSDLQPNSTDKISLKNNLNVESNLLEELDSAKPSTLSPDYTLAEMFSYNSDFTDLQRKLKFEEIRGQVVVWRLPVYEVNQSGDEYIIQTSNSYRGVRSGEKLIGTFLHLVPRNENEKKLIENLKTGDNIKIKGIINDVSMRNLVIKPAIFVDEEFSRSVLNQIYDKYSSDYDCWHTFDAESNKKYCMEVGRLDKINVNGVDRYYLLAPGWIADDYGKPAGVHVDNGLVGAFVLEVRNGELGIIAGNTGISIGTSGQAPSEWNFVNLGSSDNWGWQSVQGYCQMGWCDSSYVILAPYDKTIRNLADNLPASHSYENSSSFGNPESNVNISVELKIDSSNVNEKMFPLLLTVTGTKENKKIEPKTYKILFSEEQWKYVTPKENIIPE